jgi:hypothetical protein
VHAVPVALAGLDAGQVAVPDKGVDLGQRDAPLVLVVVEQAQLDSVGHLREDGEVGAHPVVDGAEGIPLAGPDLHVELPLLTTGTFMVPLRWVVPCRAATYARLTRATNGHGE